MTEKEFLDILYEQLTNQLSSDTAFTHTQYYREYIENEKMKGKNEQEIISALGDPRLIAKTLIDTSAESSSCADTDSEYSGSEQPKQHRYHLDLSTWYGKAIVILAAAAVLALLFLAVSFLFPVILITGVILFLISWFRKRR